MKRFLTISVLLQAVTGLMTLALVSIFAAFAVRALQSQEQARRVPIIVDISSDLFSAIQDVRVERGAVNISLAAPEAVDAETQKEIVDLRVRSGMALDSALAKLAPIAQGDTARAIVKIREGRKTLAVLRDRVDEALHHPKDRRSAGLGSDWMDANGRLVRAIDDLSAGLEREVSSGDAFIADMIKIKQVTWDVRSASGDDRVHLREAVNKGTRLPPDEQQKFAISADRIEGKWKFVQDEALRDMVPSELKQAIEAANTLYFMKFVPIRNTVLADLVAGRPVSISPHEWLNLSAPGQESIFLVAKAAFSAASARAFPTRGRGTKLLYRGPAHRAFFGPWRAHGGLCLERSRRADCQDQRNHASGRRRRSFAFDSVSTSHGRDRFSLARPSRVPRQRNRETTPARGQGRGRGRQSGKVGIPGQYEP